MHDPWGLRLAVRELLPSWPRTAAYGVAFAVFGLELAVALAYLTGSAALGLAASVGTCLLAACFAAAFFLARRLGRAVHCGCFGRLGTSVLSDRTLAVSAALAAAAAGWMLARGEWATLTPWPWRLAAGLPAAAVLLAHRGAATAGAARHASRRPPSPRAPQPTRPAGSEP